MKKIKEEVKQPNVVRFIDSHGLAHPTAAARLEAERGYR
jgi:hypothetical protein